jgi:short-subunit dehydrogenase
VEDRRPLGAAAGELRDGVNTMERQILITGGRRGLGRHLALHLAGRGHAVHLLGRATRESLDPQLRPAIASCLVADLADRAALDHALAQAAARERPFDVLIANAAIRPNGRNLLAYTADEIRAVIEVNLTAPTLIAHALIPPMIRCGYGRVIVIGSRAAFRGSALEAVYAASKAGIVALVEALSREVDGRRVTINAICPEAYSTEAGQESAGGGRVIGNVLAQIAWLLDSTVNGRILPAASWRHRLVDARRQIARAAGLMRPRGYTAERPGP